MKLRAKLFFIPLFVSLAIVLYSCCKAGTGGHATVVCHVANGNAGGNCNNATVYIYYGSSKPPTSGIGGFDDSKKTAKNGNTVTFTGLKCGTYYLYATSYDSAVSLPIQGGGPYSLLHSNRNKTEDATITVAY